jgi:hypothetical protein
LDLTNKNAGIKQKTIEFSQQKLVNGGFMVICHGTWDLKMKNDSKWSCLKHITKKRSMTGI